MRQKRAEMTISGAPSMYSGQSPLGDVGGSHGGYSVSLSHSDNNSNSSEKTSDMVSNQHILLSTIQK